MVALIGMGAVAVDIGRVAAEKAQLQNGADASALAIANYCVKNAGSCQSTGPSLASQYTTANSNDSTAVVQSVTFPTSNLVTVATSTPASGLSLSFARALNITSTQVQASATASWGGPGSGAAVLPLTFAPCQFDLTGTEQAILTQGSTTCVSDNPSGQVISGGFSIVTSDPGVCSATVQPDDPSTPGVIDPYLDSNTGASLSGNCKSVFATYLNTVVLFPVWDHTNALSGTNVRYYIKGFAAFYLDGYRFPGLSPKEGGSTNLIVDSSGKQANGIQGHFVQYVADPTKYGGGGYTGGGATLPPTLIK
jgi:hypothetical protein